MPSIILIRGGGDLASGIAIRLFRCGLNIAITELHQPLAIRRTVSFAEAMYTGEMTIEGVSSIRVTDPTDLLGMLSSFGKHKIPVIEDPECVSARLLNPLVIVDARMLKLPPNPIGYSPMQYIGIGPGFEAGNNCQVVVETNRGHIMGRVIPQGTSSPDTCIPQGNPERVIRANHTGIITACLEIGESIQSGQPIAEIIPDESSNQHASRYPINSPLSGILRGILHPGIHVNQGMKVGDVDPVNTSEIIHLVSDKALSVGGGVLEAMLATPEIRARLWV
jgi:xanthine dehydrogenase accessory factor